MRKHQMNIFLGDLPIAIKIVPTRTISHPHSGLHVEDEFELGLQG
jgi:hypothetical protein